MSNIRVVGACRKALRASRDCVRARSSGFPLRRADGDPALAMILLGGQHLNPQDPPVMRWSKERHRVLLRGIARHPRSAISAAVSLTLTGCAMLPSFGGSFIPELKDGHFIVHMIAIPRTSIAESLRLGNLVTNALVALPAVRTVAQRCGRPERADDVN